MEATGTKRALEVVSKRLSSQTKSKPSRIALLGLGTNSFLNPNLAAALRKTFPAHSVQWIDLEQLVWKRNSRLTALLNLGHAISEFGPRMGPRLWQVKHFRRWTTYLFQQRGLAATEALSQHRYLFSLQTQSTFDASVPGIPHFVYTDNTQLTNLQYGNVRREDLPVTDQWLALEHELYDKASALFVMSRNVQRSLIEEYGCPPNKVICAYGGYNAPVIEDDEQKSYDRKNILFVGIDWQRKGGPDLLAAFRSVRRQIPDATMTIVGCSPRIDEPGCQVVGRVPPSQLSRYYANASLFCLPTWYEPFGIVFLEALAHRLPIVATDVSAIPDFVTNGGNGFLVSPGDTERLASCLLQLLSNPELCRQMGERSYRVSKTYRWENSTTIMRNVIQRFVHVDSSPDSLTDRSREAVVASSSTTHVNS